MTSSIMPVLVDAGALREKIYDKATKALGEAFKLDLKGRTLGVEDITISRREFSPEEQKRALLRGDSLRVPAKGTLVLRDGEGKVINKAEGFTLVHLPYLTERHTVIADGNEYQFANQLRRKPGVYTQRGENGEIKTVFNLGRGANFDLGFNAEKGTFAVQYGTSNVPLYPMLRGLGVPHAEIASALGPSLASANAAAQGHQVETAINKLYEKLVPVTMRVPGANMEAKAEAIRKRYAVTTLDPEVTTHTLGYGHSTVTPHALLDAAKKLVAVHKGNVDVDDTDSLSFKTFHAVDDFLAERIRLGAREWSPKAKRALNGKSDIRAALHPAPLTPTINKFVTTSSLTAVPSGINPMELIDHAVKVTALGEGGIPSDRAIPFAARMTHSTHFGAIDPVRTPECHSADTEVLTSTGWKLWPAVTETDLLACRVEGRLAFCRPERLIREPYKGVMYGLTTEKLSYLVTPNHRIWCNTVDALYDQTDKNKGWRFAEASAVHGKPRVFDTGHAAMEGTPTDTFTLPEVTGGYGQAQPRYSPYFTEAYDGMVYCATVPGGLMYVRRHGAIGHWSGNSGHAGVDVRATLLAHRDDKGNLYTVVHDVKTGQEAYLRAGDLHKYVVAFPHEKRTGKVMAFVNGEVQSVDASKVTHQMLHVSHQYSPATALVPMIHNIQGNRAIMGSKMGTQALPLVEREAPYVQVRSHVGPDVSFETVFGHMVVPVSPVKGTIEKIKDGFIYVRPHGMKPGEKTSAFEDYVAASIDPDSADFEKVAASDAGLVKVPYQQHFPFPSKTYLHHTLDVKPGDKVEEGQRLGDSNYTRNGTLALGKNLSVAYMPYYGLNSNDAVVISEGAAKKLTSEHMYREVFPLHSKLTLSKAKHAAYYGSKVTPSQYAKLDETGVIKVGSKVDPKDPLVLGLVKTEIQGADLMLGKISKALVKPFKEVSLLWEHGSPGKVIDVVRTGTQIAILVKTLESMNVGDKLAGRYGNKGVVSKIIPDHEMVQDEAGRPIDVLLTSAGVISRTNPAQVIETAVGKVVEKTGKPIIYDNGAHQNAEQWAHDLLKQHGIKDKETLFDPVTKREIRGGDGKGVMVGRQYIYKLFKSTDTNFSGHGVGPYDGNEQPLKTGGDESAKGIGKMELDALIAHNARNILRENAAIKSQKNDEFWKAVQLGTPLPTPKTTFAFNKFTAMLEGAGIKVDKRDSKIKLLPMTDRDILARSRGVIENKKTLIAKNLKAEKGGLFDMQKTGGPQGTLYSHIELHEPIPNPVFVEPIRRLLGLTEKQFTEKLEQHGGSWFRDQLAGTVNVDAKLSVLEGQLKTSKGADLDNVVKQIKYLRALKDEKLKPQDAYILTKVPVIPPVFRPVLPDIHNPSEVSIGDANKLYGHLMDANHVLKTTAMPSDLPKHRGMVFNAVGAVFGTHTAMDEKLQKQEVKGYLQNIAGVGTPKGGFFQRKLMRRTQDVSGRGTAVPDPNLGMDEVGIPEQMLWQMFDKLVVARLVRQGYGALAAREMVDKKAPVAREALLAESKSRPVIINRAPTLHRWSIIAAYPKLVTGKTIRVSPFIEKGMNLDFDGDTLQVHAPVQLGAIEDAKKMTLSHLLMSDQQHNKILAFPQHEAIIGVTLATNAAPSSGPVHKFNTVEEAKAAWRSGKLKLSDTVEIATIKKAEADDMPGLDSENLPGLTTDEALSYYPVESVLGHDEEPELDS